MKEWEDTPISTAARVVTGKTPPTAREDLFTGDMPFFSPKDLDFDSFHVSETSTRISEEAFRIFHNQVLPKNSILYTSLSYGFGKIGINTVPVLTNQQISSLIPKQGYSTIFLYYLLRSCTPYIFTFNSGIDTPIVPKSVFEKIKLPMPGLPIQHKIAAILSAYDDLIEANERRIALLEKMAEELYREWFVRMRFPEHEGRDKIRGIPSGWIQKRIGEVYRTGSGGTPSRNHPEYYTGEIPWVKTGELNKSIVTDTEEHISSQALENSSAKIYPKNTVVLAMYCAMGGVSVLGQAMSINQACCAFSPIDSSYLFPYTYFHLRNILPELLNRSFGAAQQNLSQEEIKRFEILVPPALLSLKFCKISEPFFLSIEALYREQNT
jgi:type I restriction enzyme, S subunit